MNAQHKANMDKFDTVIRNLKAMGADMKEMAGDVPVTDAQRIEQALESCRNDCPRSYEGTRAWAAHVARIEAILTGKGGR